MNAKSLTVEEDQAVGMDAMELLFEDMLSFTKTAVKAWEEHLGSDAALSKAVAGGVWKAAASGIGFTDLVQAVAEVDSNVNSYTFLSEFMAVSRSGEWETILQKYHLQEHQVQVIFAACVLFA